MQVDVVIIGAGAAGLMCAIEAGKRGRQVVVIDKANKAGKKILISGGGRCNFTNLNIQPNCYLSKNPHFCKSALARYQTQDFMDLMQMYHLSWSEKTLGQLFCDQKAPAIVKMLLQECDRVGVKLQLATEVEALENSDGKYQIKTTKGLFSTGSLVVATGGASIPRMGSTDFGLQVAKQFGLKSIPFIPALVPFTMPQEWLSKMGKDLSGVTTEIKVSCGKGSFKEQLLFTHRGLSGPAMLQISSYWKKGQALSINLLPAMNAYDWLKEQQNNRPKVYVKTLLNERLPKRLVERLVEFLVPNKPINQFNNKALEQMANQLQDWQLIPSGTEGMRTAEVCLGGVDTKELSSKTFEARKAKGLYFIGEVVDVTGWLGGYNFQWAWASGWCAGQAV